MSDDVADHGRRLVGHLRQHVLDLADRLDHALDLVDGPVDQAFVLLAHGVAAVVDLLGRGRVLVGEVIDDVAGLVGDGLVERVELARYLLGRLRGDLLQLLGLLGDVVRDLLAALADTRGGPVQLGLDDVRDVVDDGLHLGDVDLLRLVDEGVDFGRRAFELVPDPSPLAP